MSKFFVALIRLATGWNRQPRLLSSVAVVLLVMLRLSIGWHFYTEGVDKQTSKDFDSARFFTVARGPLAPMFQDLVWDWDGTMRLDKDATMLHLARYRDGAIEHFGFDEQQQRAAQVAYAETISQLDWVLETNATEIEDYERGRERIMALNQDAARDGVNSLGGQRDTIRQEWMQNIAPVFTQIDKVWTIYEKSINDIATDQQRARGYYKLGKPHVRIVDTVIINRWLPWFDLTIGVCLLLGLFTPLAALVAAVFLGSVFLSQFPPAPGPGSTYYHLVEAMACLVLAATGAGRFAGLDFLFHALVQRRWPASQE